MRTIHLGSKKIEVTEQAYITFISLIISFAAMILIAFVNEYPLASFVWILVSAAIYIPFVTYVIHCMRVGKCVKLSLAYAILYAVLAALNVITLLGVMFMPRTYESSAPSVQNAQASIAKTLSPPIISKSTFSK